MLFPVGILLLDGCYPNDSLTTEETDIVLTGYYDSVNFQSLKTYYMPDTVFPIVDDGDDADPINNQDQILAEREAATLVTADARLLAAAKKANVKARPL